MSDKVFLIGIDDKGVDSLIDLSELSEEDVFNALKGNPSHYVAQRINMLSLRARYNSQRNYEVWIFSSEVDLIKEKVVINNYLINIIKERGQKVY